MIFQKNKNVLNFFRGFSSVPLPVKAEKYLHSFIYKH
jgi:hypothetical protein